MVLILHPFILRIEFDRAQSSRFSTLLHGNTIIERRNIFLQQPSQLQFIMLNNFTKAIGRLTPRRTACLAYNHIPQSSLYKSLRRWNSFAFCSQSTSVKDSEKTFELLINKLKSKVDYAEELEQSLISQNTSFGSKNREQTRIQLSQLAPIRTVYEQIKSYEDSIKDIQEMMKETKDESEKKLLQEEMDASKEKLLEIREEIWDLLIPAAKYDNASDIILELRPGAGGAESSIFVKDISEMYESYCSTQGWKCWITGSAKQSGVTAGYKFLDMRVQGEGSHKFMKSEAGVHKVIRVPQTQSKGRLHSSTISLVVMPVVPFTFEVDLKDIKYQFTKSSGPGGQAVNKIESACRATHIPTGIQVFIQEERSQDMNKKRATDLLKQRIFEIQYRKSVMEEQSRRKSQVTTLDRSEKIRTYNYPQDRITDHRTGLTKYGITSMMNGELLQQFYQAYNSNANDQKITGLIEQLYEQAGLPLPKQK